jgi:hypothetical protein
VAEITGRRRWIGLAIIGGLAFAMPALAAQPASTQTSPPTVSELVVTATKMVSELTVTAAARCLPPERGGEHAERPKVVGSFPARGAVVRPGLLVIKVTFDRPMACEGRFEDAAPLPNPCPGEMQHMLLSYDRRTVRTVCVVEPGRSYGFSLGEDLTRSTFVGLSGLPVLPARVTFSTSSDALVSDVCQALAEDPETAAQLRERGRSCSSAPPAP